MSDTMFPEPMDQMDRAMQRMDKKAWAEADAEIESLRSRLASTQLELTHAANTCADQQRRAENAEAALVESDALLREILAWKVAIECIAPELGGAIMTLARIDAHLARKP